MKSKTPTKKINSKIFIIVATVILIAIIATANFTILNKPVSNIGSSNASATEPADINSDNKVDVFDLSILLSKWGTNNTSSDLNKDGTTNVFDLSILLSKWWGVVATNPPAATGVYGTGFNMDALGNMQVGGSSSGKPNTYVAYRFRAEQSSELVSFISYWLDERYPGYGGGNGGTFRITVESDAGGIPSGNALASVDVADMVNFPTISFANPPGLISGNIYYIVFTNIDPSPTVNFSSVDLTWVKGAVLSPRQPKYSDDDYAALRRYTNTQWAVQGNYTPIIDLTYRNGARQGQGYMEVESRNAVIISGSNLKAREHFTVSGGDRSINSVAVRLAKAIGTGDLVVSLEDANGNLIESTNIPTSSLPVGDPSGSGIGSWIKGSFATNVKLTNGSTYRLVISTDASTTLWQRGIQKGSSYGFHSSTYYKDGYLQVTSDGGVTWNTVSGLSTLGDLQFYLY